MNMDRTHRGGIRHSDPPTAASGPPPGAPEPITKPPGRFLPRTRYRHPGDVIRLIGSGLVLAGMLAAVALAPDRLTGPGAATVTWLGSDPAGRVLTGLAQVAVVLAAAAAVAAALWHRRFRLLAGLAAGAVAFVEWAGVQTKGSRPFVAVTDVGRGLFIKALGSDQRDADLLYRAYRFARLRNVGDTWPAASVIRAVEHQALVGTMAERAGVRVPRVDRVIKAGGGTALLAMDRVEGSSLDQLPAQQITDDLLQQLWAEVRKLHRAGIAHRSLAASVQAFGGGAGIIAIGAVYLGAAAIAAASPTPGGLGAIEAALVAGLTGIGVAPGPAVSAVLTYRLATYWLPVIPGWAAWRLLQRQDYV